MDEDETMFSPGPNQMSYLWAPDAGQGLKGWQADLWGLMKQWMVYLLGVKAILLILKGTMRNWFSLCRQ